MSDWLVSAIIDSKFDIIMAMTESRYKIIYLGATLFDVKEEEKLIFESMDQAIGYALTRIRRQDEPNYPSLPAGVRGFHVEVYDTYA